MAFKRSKPFSIVLVAVAFMLVLVLAGEVCSGKPQRARGSGGHICEKASYVKLCKAVVKGQMGPYEATRVTVEKLYAETQAAENKLLAEKKKGKLPDNVISDCEENYDDAMVGLLDGLNSMSAWRNMGEMSSCLSAVMPSYYRCDEALKTYSPSPFAKTNARLRHMASNALFLASLWP